MVNMRGQENACLYKTVHILRSLKFNPVTAFPQDLFDGLGAVDVL